MAGPEFDRPTLAEGAEITSKMTQAGVKEFCSYDRRYDEPDEIVLRIWTAMMSVRNGD